MPEPAPLRAEVQGCGADAKGRLGAPGRAWHRQAGQGRAAVSPSAGLSHKQQDRQQQGPRGHRARNSDPLAHPSQRPPGPWSRKLLWGIMGPHVAASTASRRSAPSPESPWRSAWPCAEGRPLVTLRSRCGAVPTRIPRPTLPGGFSEQSGVQPGGPGGVTGHLGRPHGQPRLWETLGCAHRGRTSVPGTRCPPGQTARHMLVFSAQTLLNFAWRPAALGRAPGRCGDPPSRRQHRELRSVRVWL